MAIQIILDRLAQMRLSGMAAGFQEQLHQASYQELSFEERFGLLVDREWTWREDRRLRRLLKEAHLRLPSACVEDIDYHQPRGLDRGLMRSLAGCEWVRAHQNVLITGPTGTGKTYLVCALGNVVCRQGIRVRYRRVPRLLSELAAARGDGGYPRLLAQLAKAEVLVLDDWGLALISDSQARDLLEVVEDRAQTRSTVVASQLPLEHWHTALPDPTVADAILDRLVHNAHKIALRGESMRKLTVNLPGSAGGAAQ